MRRCLFLLLYLFLISPSSVQAQPTGADSIRTETRKVVERTVREYQDSVNRERLLRHINQYGKTMDEFLAERREEEKKEKRRRWVRIGAGVVLLFALFVTIARRAKVRKRS